MSVILPPQAAKRLLKDIRDATGQALRDQGIWYHANDESILKGTAMIRGSPGTPYEHCLHFFSFEFPTDYPFSPPKVTFLTTDGYTRMHPNLYREGKVCLSILGTFPGPSWSASQSLTTVLMNLLALLDSNPLSHEPAYERGTLKDSKHLQYANAVEHQMIAYMIRLITCILEKPPVPSYCEPFLDESKELLPSLLDGLLTKLESKKNQEEVWSGLVYGMTIQSKWAQLFKQAQMLKEKVRSI
jgi:ubiquitin-protein ligase